jgi:hypothetical protein
MQGPVLVIGPFTTNMHLTSSSGQEGTREQIREALVAFTISIKYYK